MPFNPSLPATNSPMLSAEMRNQFNGLKDLLDENIPASEKGAANGVASLDSGSLLVQQVDWSKLVNKPSLVLASEKGAANGVASLNASGRLVQPAQWSSLHGKPSPVADGTYTMGFGTATNGTITVTGGIVTAVQAATNAPPGTIARVSGAGSGDWNGDYVYAGDFGGKPSYTKDATHSIWWESFIISQWRFSPAIGNPAGTAYQSMENTPHPWDVVTWLNVPGFGNAPAPTVVMV